MVATHPTVLLLVGTVHKLTTQAFQVGTETLYLRSKAIKPLNDPIRTDDGTGHPRRGHSLTSNVR